jgi:hypothetical protein
VTNVPLNNLDEGSAGPELYIIRRRGTAGITRALRRKIEPDENTACLFLFTTPLDAIEYVKVMGLDPDQWEVASSKEFGGIASLLRKASQLSIHTPTHMLIDPPMEHRPSVKAFAIEPAIDSFESSGWTEQWNSGRPKTPFWLLGNAAQQLPRSVFAIPFPGGKAVCLFKTEMDAEEFRHSDWVSADEWMSDGPVDPARGVLSLKKFSFLGLSYAVVNPPPGSIDSLKLTPIEVIIDNVEEKGHILDLD